MDERSIKKMRKFLKELFYKDLKSIKVKNNLQSKIDSAQLQNINTNLKLSKQEFVKDVKALSEANKKQLINNVSSAEYSIDDVQETPKVTNGVIEGQIELPDTSENQEGENE